MVENSLLHAYKKEDEIGAKLAEVRKNLSAIRKLTDEGGYKHAELTSQIATADGFDELLMDMFKRPKNCRWKHFFKNADQLLYGEEFEFEWLGREYYQGSNNILLKKVAEKLNESFPDEGWQLGTLPFYHWERLNKPLMEAFTSEEIAELRANPDVSEIDGIFYERSAKEMRCIHRKDDGEELLEAKDDLDKLAQVSKEVQKSKGAYVFDDEALIDRECSGGYDLILDMRFEEGAEYSVLGRPYTPQEKVMNDCIVQEIDEKCAENPDVIKLNKHLDSMADNVSVFADNADHYISTVSEML